MIVLHNFHDSLDWFTAAAVTSVNNSPHFNRPFRLQPEFYVWVPARMVADVLIDHEVEYFIDRTVDYLRMLKLCCHDFLLYLVFNGTCCQTNKSRNCSS